MKKVFFVLTIVVLTLIICHCGLSLWNISAQYRDNDQIKNDMHKYSPRQTDIGTYPQAEPESPAQPHPDALAGLDSDSYNVEALDSDSAATEIAVMEPHEMKLPVNLFVIAMQMETNADIIGWINIPETNVDYPIIQTADNDFYLRRNIYKEDATAGSIFMDYRCNKELAHYNTIIYGHNMRNRSMFGDLRLFADPGFFEENQYGTLYTVCGTYTIRFFAYMVVSSDDGQIYNNPSFPEVFHEYIKDKARNYREPANRDRVITLSTCSSEFDNARGVLVAYVCD